VSLPGDCWAERVPDGIEPIVGYRMWHFSPSDDRAQLHSLNCGPGILSGCPWEGAGSGWAVASCAREGVHEHWAPAADCSCGFYAMSGLPRLLAEAPLPLSALAGIIPIEDSDEDGMTVLGRVELAGKVIEHEYGYRAEKARIAELIPFQGTERDVMRLANRLGLPIGEAVAPRSIEAEPVSEPVCPISARETEILLGIGDGLSTKEVAEGLGISPHTVRRHLERIFERLNVNDMVQVMIRCPPPYPPEPSGTNPPASPRRRGWFWLARVRPGPSSA